MVRRRRLFPFPVAGFGLCLGNEACHPPACLFCSVPVLASCCPAGHLALETCVRPTIISVSCDRTHCPAAQVSARRGSNIHNNNRNSRAPLLMSAGGIYMLFTFLPKQLNECQTPFRLPLPPLAHPWLAVSDMAYTHYLICSILFVDYFILFAIRRFSICLFLCRSPN